MNLGDHIDTNLLGSTRNNTCEAEEDKGWCTLRTGHAGQHAQVSPIGMVHFAWGNSAREEDDAELSDDEEDAINRLVGAAEELDWAIRHASNLISELRTKFKRGTPMYDVLDHLWVRHEAYDILEVPEEFFEGGKPEWAKFLHG